MPKETSDIVIKKLFEVFLKVNGRRPRILLIGISKTEVKLQKTAIKLAEIGFDLDFASSYEDPKHAAKQAIENDVHFIILYSLSEEKTNAIKAIKKELLNNKRSDIYIKFWSDLDIKNSFKKIVNELIATNLK